jgi:hypothetical protein
MTLRNFAKSLAAGAALVLVGVTVMPRHGAAQSGVDPVEQMRLKVALGFKIAPVPLSYPETSHDLVGYGSYLVNAVADCNGCHTADPTTEYVFGGIPYFGQSPKKVNPATYLAGGSDFGQIAGPNFADIVSRNLTPGGKFNRPEGGNTLSQFITIMRTGVDMDHVHPTCTADQLASGNTANCLPPPFDGNLLQVMPWPQFQDMTDYDLTAIYAYLGAVPCNPGPPTGERHNNCPTY